MSSLAYRQNAAANSAVGTNALTLPSVTQKGDTLVVEVDWTGGGAFSSIKDTQGNTFTQVGTTVSSTGVGVQSRLYYAANIKGGADAVTTVVGGAPSYHELYVNEYSGLSTTTPLDAFAVNTGTGTSFTSNALKTTAAGDFLYGAEVDSGNGFASSGWTVRSGLDGNAVADMNASAPGTYIFNGSSSGAFVSWAAAFRPNGTSASTSTTAASSSAVLSNVIALKSIVKTSAWLNVHSSPRIYSARVGIEPQNATGTVVSGPSVSNGYTWWDVKFSNGLTGWVVVNYLQLVPIAQADASTPVIAAQTAPVLDANVEDVISLQSLLSAMQGLLEQLNK